MKGTCQPAVNAGHCQKRVEWATQHLNTDWSCYVFGDEKKFTLGRQTQQMWKREGDGPALRTEFAKRQSLNMWAAIGVCGRTDLVFFTGTMDSDCYIEHLEQQVVPLQASITTHPTTFLHDNASYHKSAKTMDFIAGTNLDVERLSPLSPDFNIIERIWWMLQSRVTKREPRNLEELQQFITEEWWAISQEEVENCIVDLRAALCAVIAAEGRHVTKAEKKRYHISLYITEWFLLIADTSFYRIRVG